MKYFCTNCEKEFLGWSGKCSNCGEWGTLEEIKENEVLNKKINIGVGISKREVYSLNLEESKKDSDSRMFSGFNEFDRVLGGGFVKGEVVLLSGEPGIGKSTLLTQISLKISKKSRVLYVSGEESSTQLLSRFERISGKNNLDKDNIFITHEIDCENLIGIIEEKKPEFLIVDSIQSLISSDSRGYPGSLSQVRTCGSKLTRIAKDREITTLIIGQINKDGLIAGPKILEHIVDCVLYLEGDEMNYFRLLRALKNRFGTTNEVGVFEMGAEGFVEIKNPSEVFADFNNSLVGSAITAVLKGSRVLFIEVQALVVDRGSEVGPLRRVANGIKKPRLDMICAVLSRHSGVYLGDKDVFVNVVGGENINDTSIDLGVCASILSSVRNVPLQKGSVYVGEVGLTGLIREYWGLPQIMKDMSRLGLKPLYSFANKNKEDKRVKNILYIRDLSASIK